MADAGYITEDQERMTRARHYFEWQARVVLPELGQRVLEVGCGIGNFTEHLLNRELVVAIDDEVECVDRLRARYAGQRNLIAFARDGAAALDDLRGFHLDSCVCLNVLEHIEDDEAALRQMTLALEPGSPIVLLVPAFPSLMGPIDRRLGHFRRYTRASLRALAGRAGLRVRMMCYFNAVGFFGWWLNAKILKLEKQSESQIDFFDRFVAPLSSQVEAVVEPPFGQSILTVLETKR